jgi:hypothetical protein
MKRVRIAIVRTILSEEFIDVNVSDAKAKEIEKAKDDKDLVADIVTDEYQRAKRIGLSAICKEKDVNDKVTFIKLKITDVKE